jgi:hypothetical protein
MTEAPAKVTKAELMVDVKRDFRFFRTSRYQTVEGPVEGDDDYVSESDYRRDFYPSPFIRNYKAEVFTDLKRFVQPGLASFQTIRIIDLAGQRIGDDGLCDLCFGLKDCPVETLSLSRNLITDIGLAYLAGVLRSLKQLDTLHINENNFGDDGVEALFHYDNYSRSLRHINLSTSKLGKGSAWAIGTMFYKSRESNLEELHIGGQVSSAVTCSAVKCSAVQSRLCV